MLNLFTLVHYQSDGMTIASDSDGMLHLIRPIHTFGNDPPRQCAAVNTHLSFRRVPPQKILANEVEEELERPTCHPTSPLLASTPPTTFEDHPPPSFLPFLLTMFLPQMHLKVIKGLQMQI